MVKANLLEDGCDIMVKRLNVLGDISLCLQFGCFRSRRILRGYDIRVCPRSLVSVVSVGRCFCVHRDSLSISRTLERLNNDELGKVVKFSILK